MRCVSLTSKPTPTMLANVVSAPRGVQLGAPVQPEIVTSLAVTPPTSTCANGVNISYLRYENRGPTINVQAFPSEGTVVPPKGVKSVTLLSSNPAKSAAKPKYLLKL